MPWAAPSVTIWTVSGVGQQIALLQRVRRVLLPAVLGIHGGQRRVDAAGSQSGVGVGLGPLADRKHVDAAFGQFDRRPQTRIHPSR